MLTARLPRVAFKALASRLALLFTASYGLLYFSYKYLQPAIGVGDSDYYYPMFRAPLNFHVAQSPFILRQLSAVLTWLVWRAHIFYPNRIAFVDPNYDQHVFFAALLVNWIALVLTALTAGLIAEELLGARNSLLALVASLLCILSFHTQSAVITDMVEGPAWLLLALAFLAGLRRSATWMAVLLALAIFERELILLAVGFLAALDLLPWRAPTRRFRLYTLGISILCFAAYMALRHHFPGYELQTDSSAVAHGLFQIDFVPDLFFQAVLSQNVLFIALATFFAARSRIPAVRYWMPKLLATFVFIAVISLAAYENNNTGRLAGVLTPIFAAFAALALASLEPSIRQTPSSVPSSRVNNLPAAVFLVASTLLVVVLGLVPRLHYRPDPEKKLRKLRRLQQHPQADPLQPTSP